MMESLINELLMGTLDGKRPENPGFKIIASQNSVSMAGRRLQSTALARRMGTYHLTPCSDEEMVNILLNKGLLKDDAKKMVTAFSNNLKKARANHLSPAPTFRDLIKLAEQVVKGMAQQNNRISLFFTEDEASFWDEMPDFLQSTQKPLVQLREKKANHPFFAQQEKKQEKTRDQYRQRP